MIVFNSKLNNFILLFFLILKFNIIYHNTKEHVRLFLRHLITRQIIDDYQVVILFSDNASEYKSAKTLSDLKDEHQFGADKKIIRLYNGNYIFLFLCFNIFVGSKTWQKYRRFNWVKN